MHFSLALHYYYYYYYYYQDDDEEEHVHLLSHITITPFINFYFTLEHNMF